MTLSLPKSLENRDHYILELILENFLGLDINYSYSNDQEIKISHENKTIIIPFHSLIGLIDDISIQQVPQPPLECLDLLTCNRRLRSTIQETSSIPVLYGNPRIEFNENSIYFGIDIFASAFFMLTRYEEVVSEKYDRHERFPAYLSLAFKEDFLHRPIIDEYVELLRSCLNYLWPNIAPVNSSFNQYVSCDVDLLFDDRSKFPKVLKTILGDLIKRKSTKTAFRTLSRFVGNINSFDTFDFMMTECENAGVKQAYYFIPQKNKLPIDGDYDITGDYTRHLMKKIAKRGHEIGFHPSYYSYLDKDKTNTELTELKSLLKELNITSPILGGRQHYLRWKTPFTARNWEELNLEYDSTLGYADHIGFRCGTCREFPFFDILEKKRMNLKIRPLIAMDVTLFSELYMNLTPNEALNQLKYLKRTCKLYNGNFTLLWHNNYFDKPLYKKIYQEVILHKEL